MAVALVLATCLGVALHRRVRRSEEAHIDQAEGVPLVRADRVASNSQSAAWALLLFSWVDFASSVWYIITMWHTAESSLVLRGFITVLFLLRCCVFVVKNMRKLQHHDVATPLSPRFGVRRPADSASVCPQCVT